MLPNPYIGQHLGVLKLIYMLDVSLVKLITKMQLSRKFSISYNVPHFTYAHYLVQNQVQIMQIWFLKSALLK